jgi:hypothetical protein
MVIAQLGASEPDVRGMQQVLTDKYLGRCGHPAPPLAGGRGRSE